MHSRVASCAPTTPKAKEVGVIDLPNKEPSRSDAGIVALDLRMAFEAQVVVPFHEHFGIDRAVRLMARRAAFAQSLVFVNIRPGLLAVAGRTALVQAGHGQSARRLHDVRAMRIMALHAVHSPFEQRMMLGEVEFGVSLQMTAKTGFRVAPWIEDETAAAATRRHMFAAGPMTRLATGAPHQARSLEMNPRVRAGRENTRDVGVAFGARFVAHERGALNQRRRHNRPLDGRAGDHDQRQETHAEEQDRREELKLHPHSKTPNELGHAASAG